MVAVEELIQIFGGFSHKLMANPKIFVASIRES